MEMENEICFSKQPIKQCPMGTYPTGWEFEEEENKNANKHFTTKNIPFICMPRSDSEARNLLNQYRQLIGNNQQQQQQLELNNYKQHSIVEKVLEPKECRRL